MADFKPKMTDQDWSPGAEAPGTNPEVVAASPHLDKKVAEDIRVHRALVETVGANYELAPPGSPKRILFEELLNGASTAEALRHVPGVDLGPRPERTVALLKAWADERRIYEGKVADSNLTPAQVAANRMVTVRVVGDESIRDNAARIGAAVYESRMLNAAQNEAIREEAAKVNKALETIGPRLDDLKANPMADPDEIRRLTDEYADLMSKVVPTGAAGIAIYKGMAAEDAKRLLEIGDEHGDYDLDGLKLATREMNQDLGVVGQVREPSGSTQEGWRFRGWERDQDVVLNPAWQAEVALKADPDHNADYLQARMEAGQAKAMPFYEHVARVHEASLDKQLEFAPKYDPRETLSGAAAGGLVSWNAQPNGQSLEGEIVPPAPVGDKEELVRVGGGIPVRPGDPMDAKMFTGADIHTTTPQVITAQHADFDAHARDTIEQNRRYQARLLTSAGLAGLQGGLALMEGASRWAASPDTGMAGFFYTNAHLALNGLSTGVQTYHQSTDAKERAFGALIQQGNDRRSLLAKVYSQDAMGAISQLKEIVPPVGTLHKAEMEVRNQMRPVLNAGWEEYKLGRSTENYREIFTQALASQNTAVQGMAIKGLQKVQDKAASGGQFTQADFDEIVQSNRAQAVFGTEGGAFDRLRQVSGLAANDGAAHLRSIERTFMDAKRISWEQSALTTDRGRNFLMAAVGRQDGFQAMTGPRGEWNFTYTPPKQSERDQPQAITLTEEQVLSAFTSKWSAERQLITANVALIDASPELAASMKRHGMDAASALEGTYTNQSSPSSNSVRVADAIRTWAEKPQNFSMPPDQSLIPRGWNADGARQVGVADLGNGQYAALLVGHDLDGKAMDAKVLVFQRQDNGEIRLSGRVNIDPKDMTTFIGGANPDKLKQTLTAGLEAGVRDTILRQRALAAGSDVKSLPQQELIAAETQAKRRVSESFRFLDDRAVMGSLSRAVAQSSSSDGFQKLSHSPLNATILEFPKPGHIANISVGDRFRNGLDVAIGESNNLAQRGVKQMESLHGITQILNRLDSNRTPEKSSAFHNLRNAYDSPFLREAQKSSLFDPLMSESSASGNHGPVVVDDPWPVGRRS